MLTVVVVDRVTEQGFACPAQAPFQPTKTNSGAGANDSVTAVPLAYYSRQSVPQSIPDGLEVTTPAPLGT